MTKSKDKKDVVIKTLEDCIEALKKRTNKGSKDTDNEKQVKQVA